MDLLGISKFLQFPSHEVSSLVKPGFARCKRKRVLRMSRSGMEANCLLAMSAVILTRNKCLTWNITWMFSIGNLVRSQARNR